MEADGQISVRKVANVVAEEVMTADGRSAVVGGVEMQLQVLSK